MRGLRQYSMLALFGVLGSFVLSTESPAQGVRNRISVLVDSSASMLQTPQQVTFVQSCLVGGTPWNPCTFTGNPSAAQEACNACVRDTIRFRPTCGGANIWSASCRTDYANCVAALTGQACSAVMSATEGVATRGDGSLEITGCDLDGSATADDSKLFKSKVAVRATATAVSGVEFSLWRFRQVVGGQACTTDAECPDSPGGSSILTCENVSGSNVCAFDADLLDGPTTAGFEGQCDAFTHTGSPASFSCAACDFSNSYDRTVCELYSLQEVRSGGASPLGGASVACFPSANPSHRFITYHGAVGGAGSCDPSGGDRLVDFPPDSSTSNVASIASWLDHTQTAPAAPVELRANGGGPLAAMLRDLRVSLLATLATDVNTACRRYRVALVVDNTDNCESNAAAVTAAAALQDLGFTPPGGMPVSGYAVPVHVIGFGVCPAGTPNCAAIQALDAVAAAGATTSATRVSTEAELSAALAEIAASVNTDTCVESLFDDGFE